MMSDSFPYSQSNLLQMVAETRRLVEQRKTEVPLAGVRALAGMQRRAIDLSSALHQREKKALIPRLRPRLPNQATDPLLLAKRWENSGAAAIAVATDQQNYHSSLADLTRISESAEIPIIRQDFIYDEYQIVEARAAGADAILLMAALLNPPMLRNLISITQRNRMSAIVQVQSFDEIYDVIEFEPRIIAISNRNMHSFEVDLDTTLRLAHLIPAHMSAISMNGFETVADIQHVLQSPIKGVIVSQHILADPVFASQLAQTFQLGDL